MQHITSDQAQAIIQQADRIAMIARRMASPSQAQAREAAAEWAQIAQAIQNIQNIQPAASK